MQRIWLRHYPESVAPEINLDTYKSIPDALAQSCDKHAQRVAFAHMDCQWTYAEAWAKSRDFAAFLQTELQLEKGQCLAIMLPNCMQYVVALFGALRAGLVVTNVNPLYTARELEHQLSDSGATAILIMENFAATLEKIYDSVPIKTVVTTQLGDMFAGIKGPMTNFVLKRVKKAIPDWELPHSLQFRHAMNKGAKLAFTPAEISREDLAFLQYTGGTTGPAKGAMLSHGNLTANLLQMHAWFGPEMANEGEVIITALPMYHVFALTVNTLIFFTLGGKNVLITNPRDMPGFIKVLSRHKFTAITGVNTLFNGLLNTPGFSELDFASLKLASGGGMAVQKVVAQRWKEVTGVPIVEGYGLSETSPVASCNRLDIEEFNHSIGLPVPSTEFVIRDNDDKDVRPGEPGELCIRGPQVMSGYWQQPEANAQAFTSDGFFRSGDIATMDEQGYFYIVDRKKDMILVSGFNVFPNEIEDVIVAHEDVLEAACIGVPDEKSGEAVKLFVVKKNPELNANAVYEYCKQHLTGYKVPKHIEFIDEVPKSNVGKILRRELR